MTVQNAFGVGAGAGMGRANVSSTRNSSSMAEKSSFDTILEDFKKLASQTPAERAAEGVLKRHGLTREHFGKLPKAEKEGIMREIDEAVRRAVGVKEKQASFQTGI